MKLRYSNRGSDSRGKTRKKRTFFSRFKGRVLTTALAVGMVAAFAVPESAVSAQQGSTPSAYEVKARKWLKSNKRYFNLKPTDRKKERVLVKFIASKMKSGIWYLSGNMRASTKNWPIHPRCEPSLKNGDCWAMGFRNSWDVTVKYCRSKIGKTDTERCKANRPRQTPPGYCYGYTNFSRFVKKCEMPFLSYISKRP